MISLSLFAVLMRRYCYNYSHELAKGGKQENRPLSHRYNAPHIEKTLGQGTFGKVKLATHDLTGQRVAIKILEKKKIVDISDIERVSR